MKFMIVQPMNGIEESKIWEQREEIRKFIESKGHEVIDTFFMEEASEDVKTSGIYYLGRAFMNGLAYADAIVLAPGWKTARGCLIERAAAYKYGIEVYEYFHKGDIYFTPYLIDHKPSDTYAKHECEHDCIIRFNYRIAEESAGTFLYTEDVLDIIK